MSFIAKGEEIFLQESSGTGVEGTYLYKRMNQDGSFSDVSWGSVGSDFSTPVINSTWTTYGSYKYIPVGLVRQIYQEEHKFTRNLRFNSAVRLSNTVSPLNTDISDLVYITALVRGGLTDDASVISQRLIDEFSSGTYNYVLAIGTMNRAIADYRPINIDVNNIKTFEGAALSTMDYTLSTSEAVYLVNMALASNAMMENITSLYINIYQQNFIEFLGDNTVNPGSIGKTEMNPDYKAERAINNYIITIDNEHIVDNVLIISPDYTTQIDNNSIYYIQLNSSTSFNKISLGYFDTQSGVYVSSGTKYDCTVSGTVENKLCIAAIVNNEFTMKAML